MFHLPNRYDPKKSSRKKKGDEVAAPEEILEEEEEDDVAQEKVTWEGEVEDSKVRLEDMESLPTIGRMPKPKMRVQGKKKEEKRGREKLKEELILQREVLSFAPNKKMLQENNLVAWLPYDSIEVVFNDKNTWANRQSHHPASITYDLDEDPEEVAKVGWKWEPLLKITDDEKKHGFQCICPNVSVQPELRPNIVDELQEDLRTEMMQNLQLYRGKKGMDTMFDHNEELMAQMSLFLDIQETWRQIDPDSPGTRKVLDGYNDTPPDLPKENFTDQQKFHKFVCKTLKLRIWNQHGSPFFHDYKGYKKEQDHLWRTLEKQFKEFIKKEDSFPIKRGKQFIGFPVHFCTSDQESIRQHLMTIEQYKDMLDMAEDDVFYTIECKMFGRLGGILSVWLYVGMQQARREIVDE